MKIKEWVKEYYLVIIYFSICIAILIVLMYIVHIGYTEGWLEYGSVNATTVLFSIGLIIGFEGGLGSGKTIGMVRYLHKDHANGKKIFANFGLRGIDYESLNVLNIMENKNLNNVSIGIDEITVFMDCRTSMKKLNRLLSYFILQTRKRNCDLYFTTQDFGMCDKRLLKYCDIQILCKQSYDENGNEVEHARHYTIIDVRDKNKKPTITRFHLDISVYYSYYDTNEVIMPPISI